MAATSKAGFGHADRSSDGGEALDSETSASEELAVADGVEDSFDWRRRAETCGDNSLGQQPRDLVAPLARALICDALGTGRNMVTLLAYEDSSEVQMEKRVHLDLDLFPTSAARPVF